MTKIRIKRNFVINFLKQIFTWWHKQTVGTFIYTLISGKLVGKDEFGNKYYVNSKGKRWVIYKNTVESTNREIKTQINEIYTSSFSQLENVQKQMSKDLNDSIMKIDAGLENMLTNSLNSLSGQLVTLTTNRTLETLSEGTK